MLNMLRPILHAPKGGWPARHSPSEHGFTLLELMVTVSIVAILGALAAPNFQTMIQANRTRTVASELMATLNLARSEAARRGQPVSVCRSSNGSSCASSGTGWDSGWIAFVNEDGLSEGTSALRDSDELLLQARQNLPAGVTVRTNSNFTNAITFQRTGLVWGLGTGTFAICAGSAAELKNRQPQAVVVIATRAVLATDSNGDGIPEKGEEGNLQSCENP
jgi:type IV fimbrial biogenesis protein FimT